MPRDGAIIFRDLIGKLDVLPIECAKCGRAYHVRFGAPNGLRLNVAPS